MVVMKAETMAGNWVLLTNLVPPRAVTMAAPNNSVPTRAG